MRLIMRDPAAEEEDPLAGEVDETLDDLLGHPETCPHGNPIDEATAKARPSGVPLSEVDSGSHVTVYRITEAAEEDPTF